PGPSRSRAPRSGLCRAVHALAQAARPHVRPHLVDVGRALLLGALLPDLVPPGGYLVAGQPERVLVLVVAEHLVPRVVVHVTVPFVGGWVLLLPLPGHRGLLARAVPWKTAQRAAEGGQYRDGRDAGRRNHDGAAARHRL